MLEDLGSFCRTKTDVQGLEDAFMEEAQRVEDNFPEVMKLLLIDPAEKIRTITTFKHIIVSEEYLCDHKKYGFRPQAHRQ